jgi:hypothetical protein
MGKTPKSELAESAEGQVSELVPRAVEGQLIPRAEWPASDSATDMFPTQANTQFDVVIDSDALDRAVASQTSSVVGYDPMLSEITYDFRKNRGLVRSSGVLRRVPRKVMNILVWNALPEIDTRQMHKIKIIDVLSMLQADDTFGGKNRNHLVEVLRELKSIQINLHYDSQGRENDITQTGILSDFQYKSSEGMIYYGFSKITNALIADASFAAQIDVRLQAEIKSRYSLSLLEIALAYMTDGATPTWPVNVWRRDLGAMDNPTYAEYRYLKSKVITPAVDEVLKVAKIRLTQEVTKVGRQIVAFRFVIDRLSTSEMGTLSAVEIRNNPAFKALIHIGVTKALAAEAVIRDAAHAAEVAAETEARFNAGKVENPGAWAAKMLREYVQLKSGLEREKDKKMLEEARKEKRAVLKKSQVISQTAEMEENRKIFNKRMIDEYLNSLSPAELINAARAATVKSYGLPTERNKLSTAIMSGLQPDGGFEKKELDNIIKNVYFRGYVLGIVDPGFVKCDQYLRDKFGDEAFARFKLI